MPITHFNLFPLNLPTHLNVFPLFFHLDQETALKEIVMVYARRGFPFTGKQVCVLAYEMAARDNNKGFSPVKRKAGRCWLKGFYKRHPEIQKKTSINLSIGRAIAANPVQIGRFFNQYTQWLEDWGLECTPNRIWNVDECGIGDVPQMTSVVGVTGERAFQTVSGEKPQNTTIVSYISAGGFGSTTNGDI